MEIDINYFVTKAINTLNELGKGDFTLREIKKGSGDSFWIEITDEEMLDKVRKNFAHFNHDTTVYVFTVEIWEDYFKIETFKRFDASVGILEANIPVEKKGLLRTMWRILYTYNDWKKNTIKAFPILK